MGGYLLLCCFILVSIWCVCDELWLLFSGVFCFWLCAQDCYFWKGSRLPGLQLNFLSTANILDSWSVILILIIFIIMQALIQFSDADTASAARNALDGRSIPRHALSISSPFMFFSLISIQGIACSVVNFVMWCFTFRYLLPEHVGSCHLRISYSAHTDLNIKFQSHRSR